MSQPQETAPLTTPVRIAVDPATYESKLCPQTLKDIEEVKGGDGDCGFCRDIGEPKGCRGDIKKAMTAHVVVVTDTPAPEWSSKLSGDSSEEDLVRMLTNAFKGTGIGSAKVSLATFFPNRFVRAGDVLMCLPSEEAPFLVWRGATKTDADGIVKAVEERTTGAGEVLSELRTVVMSCSHTKRDARCGYCGPVLADLALTELSEQADASLVGKVSHIGGHVYAGNVLMYDRTGLDWFGFVNPANLPDVLHRRWNPEVARRWRARVGYLPSDLPEMPVQGGASAPAPRQAVRSTLTMMTSPFYAKAAAAVAVVGVVAGVARRRAAAK